MTRSTTTTKEAPRPSAATPEKGSQRHPSAPRKGTTRQDAPIDPTPWQDAEELRWAARHWAARISVRTPIIQIRPMRTKWASLSTGRRMTLNSELIPLPKALGEFAIVHELVHLLAPNHGKVFKSFMYAYMPDWQARERQLQSRASTTT